MDMEEENGGKGGGNENMNLVLSAGDSDDCNGKHNQQEVLGECKGIVGLL
jgi:hypothetical protein